jgi:hypothetical protein
VSGPYGFTGVIGVWFAELACITRNKGENTWKGEKGQSPGKTGRGGVKR